MSQAILGPSVIENGLNPETAFFAFSSDGMAILGPARGPSDEVDPIARLFVILGKLISARRRLDPLTPGVVDSRGQPEHLIRQFGHIQEAVLEFNPGEEYEVVWKPLAGAISKQVLDPFRRQTDDLDQRTRRFIAGEMQAILCIDPTLSVEQRMQSLDEYLRLKGYTVETGSEGFRDFIARSFVGPDGQRVNLPTSDNPSFPDSWITPDVIDSKAHGPSRREWSILF